MCVVSNLGDVYRDRWYPQQPVVWQPPQQPPTTWIFNGDTPSREEFDALKREVEEMHDLLRAAKRIDELTGEPDCEMDEKVALLKKVADAVGVDLSDVFHADASP
jgi:hypothetical protein